MKTPDQIADEIVAQFSWSTNVSRNGRLVGQQVIVAEAVAEAIKVERARITRLEATLEDARRDLYYLHRKRTPATMKKAIDNAVARIETAFSPSPLPSRSGGG
jgi:hypothetical protein